MNTKWILGADPGRFGAVVLLNAAYPNIPEGEQTLLCFPTKVANDKINSTKLYKEILPYAKDIVFMVQEHVHAIFGSSASGSFEFGDSNGALRAILDLIRDSSGNNPEFITALPKIWQKEAWKNVPIKGTPVLEKGTKTPKLLKSGKPRIKVDTKGTSMDAAHTLFPGQSFVMPRCRIEHDGCIDAALIAYYGLVKYKKSSGH